MSLGPGDPECDRTGRGYRIVEVVDGSKCGLNTVKIVRVVESFVITPDSLIDLDGESKSGPLQ
jgi:hypothetical protein